MQRELFVKIVLTITTLTVISAILAPAYAGGRQNIETDSAGRQIVSQNPSPDPVTTERILDGTIQARDMSPDFIEFKKLDDANSGHGWDPNGSTTVFGIADSKVDTNSVVLINTLKPSSATATTTVSSSAPQPICQVYALFGSDGFSVRCDQAPEQGSTLNYVVFRSSNTR